MTYQPVVPIGGFAGWQFLQRTMETQRAAHDAAPQRQREIAYFNETIASVDTAEELVSDRRLLGVALGAFGLDEDINNRAFLQQILEGGTLDRQALANKLTDRRYREFSAAFGFGDSALPATLQAGFAAEITGAYLERQFEIGVGNVSPDMRLALGLERDLPALIERGLEDETAWFSIMGNPPLRRVFETAFGLPAAFGALDLEKQLETFRDRSERAFGASEVKDFADPETREELLRVFLVRAELQGGVQQQVTSPALTLLSQASSANLFALL